MNSDTNSSGVRRGDTVNHLFAQLRQAVLTGKYAPGQRLIEADLTRDYNVSRGPLREAFRQLAAEQLVEIVPNRGVVVRRLSRKSMLDLFLIRQSLEGLAAAQAAARMTEPEPRRRFEMTCKRIRDLRRQRASETFTEENALLHRIIVELADNSQLATLVQQLQLPLARFQFRSALDQSYRNASMEEHDEIIDAILAGIPHRANAAMRRHLKRAGKTILTFNESTF